MKMNLKKIQAVFNLETFYSDTEFVLVSMLNEIVQSERKQDSYA